MRIIEVADYNPKWNDLFDSEREQLERALGPVLLKCHHIGSTSVPGLAAKPIIDILLEVTSLSELDSLNSAMETLGYEPRGEYGIPGRRYFPKGEDLRTHHIHAFEPGDPGVQRHLLFRDYLRLFPEKAGEYAAVKRGVAARCDNDMEAYCDGKDAFVKALEQEALNYFHNGGYSNGAGNQD